MFNWLWSKIKAPFETVPETFEVRDSENNAIVAYQRPEEMAIKRWVAGAGYSIREDIEEAVELGQASTPMIGLAVLYIGIMWIGLLVSVIFGMALKGAGLLAILVVVWKITYVMVVATLFLVSIYGAFLGLALVIAKRGWKLFNRYIRREPMSWKDAFQRTVGRFVYAN